MTRLVIILLIQRTNDLTLGTCRFVPNCSSAFMHPFSSDEFQISYIKTRGGREMETNCIAFINLMARSDKTDRQQQQFMTDLSHAKWISHLCATTRVLVIRF